jgi:hypothetical protein
MTITADQGASEDRLLIWPSIAAASYMLIPCVAWGYEYYLLGGLLFFLSLVPYLFALRHFLVIRRWRSALTGAAIPILLVFTIRPFAVLGGHAIHLERVRGDYDAQAAASPRINGYHFMTFEWSFGFAGGPIPLLVYDESDEIGTPLDRQRIELGSPGGLVDACTHRTHHLQGHYYVCEFSGLDLAPRFGSIDLKSP